MRSYELTIPYGLILVLKMMIYCGLGFFILFLLFKLFGNQSATYGHLYFFLIFALIGFVGMLAAKRWRIYVKNEEITIRYSVKKERRLTFADIDYASMGLKHELSLFSNGKKMVTIDRLTVNREQFLEDLKERQIKISYQE
ncbi:DUF6560 family protein [Enterococcus sp. LJL51]|uniref:DUF6560 family protein n=1 Tax=Enterococcus sp. LJL51 TaxID=3416656 RepID=UPI003CF929F2